jgi:small-conductance mechanosensitive channel
MEFFGLTEPDVARFYASAYGWLVDNVLTANMALQLLLVAVAFAIAWQIGHPIDRDNRFEQWFLKKTGTADPWLRRLAATLDNLMVPIIWIALQWLLKIGMSGFGQPTDLMRVTASLLNAWVLIHIVSSLVSSPFWQKTFATFAWSIAALYILRLLGPTQAFLDSFAFDLGDARLSPLQLIKALLFGALLLWGANAGGRLLQLQLKKVPDLTPSVEVLIVKLARFGLIALAILIALSAVGIKLTTLAVFSGAVGIGVGFGLQKVISNFVSGIILLLDRSIRPGDVIEVGNTYGWVKNLGARYTSVITRDGTEFLIPNETMITEQVVNWSYSDTNVRRKVPIGISYNADVPKAMELVVEAARETPRILAYPEPRCNLMAFGESSVDLEARFWIADPHNGVNNVKSDFLLNVWHKFKAHAIEIPFPQRDLNIRDGAPVKVVMVREDPPAPRETAADPLALAAAGHDPAGLAAPLGPRGDDRMRSTVRTAPSAPGTGMDPADD